MKYLGVGAAMAPLVASMAILPRDTIKNFGLIAIHSASPIHLSSVNAAGNKFWIGKDTQTYCPAIEGLDCSHFQNITAFSQGSKSDTLGLVRPNSSLQNAIRFP